MQRTAGNRAVARALARAGNLSNPAGQALDPTTQARLGPAFGGVDLSSVRVHTAGEQSDSTRTHGAHAVTLGEHIAFAPGEYAPGTPLGDALIAHEVAHVIQQRGCTEPAVTSPPAEALERDANRSARSVLSRLWAGVTGWSGAVARDARPRLVSPLALRACIRGCSPEQETKLKTLADELLAMKDPSDMADRLASVDQGDLEAAKRALDSDGGDYRGTPQAQVLEWELAWRARDWRRLVALSDTSAKEFRLPYRSRIVAAILAGSLTVDASGQPSDWATWTQARLSDLMENPAGFRLVALLLLSQVKVTLRAPKGAEVGKGSDTNRVVGDDDSVGRYDVAAGKAGTAAQSVIVLDNTVASNQIVLGGTPSAPTLIDAEETVTVGHELIHALHNARGENIAPTPKDVVMVAVGGPSSYVKDPLSGQPVSAEELWTVQGSTTFQNAKSGASQTYNVTQSPSENDLRRERGLPPRLSHYGALDRFFVAVSGGEHVSDLVAAHYRFKAPEKGQAPPTADARTRLFAVIAAMVSFTDVPQGISKIPLPHPQHVVLQVRFIDPKPDLVDAATLLEAVP